MNVRQIREDFPILKRKIHGRPLAYLDNAATTQKPAAVIEALKHYYEHFNANIHRAVHTLGEEATEAYEASRKKAAEWIGAPDYHSVLFTRNCTEAINLVAVAWGRKYLKPGDEILLTELEHHSNLIPWHFLKEEKGVVLKFIPFGEDGLLDLSKLPDLLTSKTKLVSVTQVSNALGSRVPVKEIVQKAHEAGARVLVDGAQSVPHMAVDVVELDCDFLAFSAHKMLGPTGIGALYGKREILEEMDPFMGGGEMIREVWLDRSTYNKIPWKYEAGTPNIADAIAFGKAIEYLEQIGIEAVAKHETELTRYALSKLGALPGVVVYGPENVEDRGGLVSFNLLDVHPHDVGTILDQDGVAIRAGHHCAQPVMRKLGIAGTVRASFYLYNTMEEIDVLIQSLHHVFEVFHRVAAR